MNVKSGFKLIGLILIALTLVNCESKNNANAVSEEVSGEVVLKVGNIEITKYELEKNKGRYFDPKSGVSLTQWSNNFIDDTYLLADAFDKKYDTLPEVSKLVAYTAHSMISQVGGYLWLRMAEPQLVLSDDDLKSAYRKRDKVFYVEYLQFPDLKTLTSVLNGDTIIKTEADFIRLVNICRSHNVVKFNNRAFVYPFDELAIVKDDIYNLDKGGVTKLMHTNNGIFAIHLIKKEDTKQMPFKDEKNQIEYTLKSIKTGQIIDDQNSNVFGKAKISMNDDNENRLLKMLLEKQESAYLASHSNDTLMTYVFNNKTECITINDFLDYYKNAPFVRIVEEKQELTSTLRNLVMEKYEYAQADSLGIFKEEKYILDKRNFKNRVMLEKYDLKEFSNKIQISDNELHTYYDQNSKKLTEAETCYITLFTFKTRKNALENQMYLQEKLNQGDFASFLDSTIVKGLISYKTNVVIKKDDTKYPQQLLQNIFSSTINSLSGSQDLNNTTVLYMKTKEEGKKIKSFDDMKNDMKSVIEQSKFALLKSERIKDLKTKYSISLNKL